MAPVPFRVELTRTQDVARVAVAGEVDMATADALAEALESALGQTGVHEVVVDLAAVSFLASSGITALVRAHQIAGEQGARLVVTGCQPTVAQVLTMTQVDRILNIAGQPVPDP